MPQLMSAIFSQFSLEKVVLFSVLNLNFIVGPQSCRTGAVRFVAGWYKRWPEPGFNFVTFSFVYVWFVVFIRSTSESRPNNIEGKNVRPPVRTSVRPYVRPSTKSFFNLNEIRYIGTGRWVMHDSMRYGRIEGQGQGHEPFKVWIPSIFKIYLLRHLQRELANDH